MHGKPQQEAYSRVGALRCTGFVGGHSRMVGVFSSSSYHQCRRQCDQPSPMDSRCLCETLPGRNKGDGRSSSDGVGSGLSTN